MTRGSDYSQRIAESCRVLEVPPGASDDQLKQAYRDLARIWHPDRCPNDERLRGKAEDRFTEISEAFHFLIRIPQAERDATPAGTRQKTSIAADHVGQSRSTAPVGSSRTWFRTPPHVTPALFSSICAGAAIVVVLVGGAGLYEWMAAPFRSVQGLRVRSAGFLSPPAPVIPDLAEIGSRTVQQLSQTLPAIPRRETSSSGLAQGAPAAAPKERPQRRRSRQIMPQPADSIDLQLSAEISRSHVLGDLGILILTNDTDVNCTAALHGGSVPTRVPLPAKSSVRMGNISIGVYTPVLNCGSGENLRVGSVQFVSVQAAQSYSDRYEIVLSSRAGYKPR
jgi:hypothetical protein